MFGHELRCLELFNALSYNLNLWNTGIVPLDMLDSNNFIMWNLISYTYNLNRSN